MAKAVFTHADGSIYDDLPELHYHFPQTYLRAAEAALGDWIVYYEPRRIKAGSKRAGGRQAYFAVARLTAIDRDPSRDGHFYGRVADYLPFPNPVPFRRDARYYESALERPDGHTNKGAFGRSVRPVPDREFSAILAAGFAGLRILNGGGRPEVQAARSLLVPDRKLLVPEAAFLRPHKAYLAHHRAGFKG